MVLRRRRYTPLIPLLFLGISLIWLGSNGGENPPPQESLLASKIEEGQVKGPPGSAKRSVLHCRGQPFGGSPRQHGAKDQQWPSGQPSSGQGQRKRRPATATEPCGIRPPSVRGTSSTIHFNALCTGPLEPYTFCFWRVYRGAEFPTQVRAIQQRLDEDTATAAREMKAVLAEQPSESTAIQVEKSLALSGRHPRSRRYFVSPGYAWDVNHRPCSRPSPRRPALKRVGRRLFRACFAQR